MLGPDGGLDRPALAAVVFGDPQARARLNAIVHPRVRDRTEELIARAPGDAVVVQDVPLLVETGSSAAFALVVVVHADAEERVRRLVESRGMAEADARARIAAQASDEARRAAADVVLDNGGSPADLRHGRRRAVAPPARAVRGQPAAPATGAARAGPGRPGPAVGGATAPGSRPGSPGRPVRVCGTSRTSARPPCPGCPRSTSWTSRSPCDPGVVDDPGAVEAVRAGLDAAGFPRIGVAAAGEWRHAGADPGRPVRLVLRPAGSPAWRADLLWRDWLRADGVARSECREPVGRAAVRDSVQSPGSAITRAEEWAASSGWTPSLEELPGP